MSIALAQAHHIFGLKNEVTGNVTYLDEQTVLFPSGNQFVRFNIDQKQQKFISSSDKCSGISAIALSPNRRYAAIAEQGDKPQITIWDLVHDQSKKKKTLTVPEMTADCFVSLAFSPDSKYLIAQTCYPDYLLVYFAWEKAKVMAQLRTSAQSHLPVYHVSFNPRDNTQICVTGNQIMKLYRYTEGNLKQFGYSKSDPQNCLCHAWVSEERVMVGTETGRLLLFENGEVKMDFVADMPTGSIAEASGSRMNISEDGKRSSEGLNTKITAIAAFSKGFACASGVGTVHLFEKGEDKDFYKKIRVVKISREICNIDPLAARQQNITHMCVSPSEENLTCSTDHKQLYTVSLSTNDLGKGEEGELEPLTYTYHSGEVTGLDVCVRKPLLATCSTDCSVRIWNFENNVLDIYKVFQEEAYSIAIHPSGLYILVGFSDKLRLMNLLIDDIRTFREFAIRGCKECSFSHGGHLFAAVHGTVVQIYSSTTFDNIMNLKGHNGKVRSIKWVADDSKLITSGIDGAVYEWNVQTGKRVNESVLKTCQYSCVAVSPTGKHTYAVGSDKTIKEITESSILRTVDTDVVMVQIEMSHSGRMMFTGAQNGSLRAVKFPLTEGGDYTEHIAHSSAITKMRITYDDAYLVTVSSDGCVLMWKITDKEGRGAKHDKESIYAQEILITKTDLEEKNQLMSELKTRVEELKMENEYQLRLKDMNYNEKIKELTEKFIQEMENLKTKNQVLKTERDKEVAKHEEEISEIVDRNSKNIVDIESTSNQKLMLEYEKYQELQNKSQKMQEDYERQLQEGEEGKEQALEELTEYYETKLEEKTTLYEQTNHEMRQQHREYEETKRQIEEDADREILDVKNKYERRLRDEIETNMRLKGESGIMRKKFNSLNKEIDMKNGDIEHLRSEKVKLETVIKSLEKDINGLKKEIQERDETIQDKEKRIYDLKKKNQELEKFKFVLDYKIKELKKQIEPREAEIKSMKEQIEEMESELERFHKNNTALELNISEMKQKMRAVEKEYQRERQKLRDMEAKCKRMKVDIHNCVGLIQDPKMLKQSIRNLFDTHCHDDFNDVSGLKMDRDIEQEYARQREHLEHSVTTLRRKLVKDSEIHRTDNVRIMQENVSLIKEINDLRKELKLMRQHLHLIESTIGANKLSALISKNYQPQKSMGCKRKPGEEEDMIRRQNFVEEAPKIIEMQKSEIKRLRDELEHEKERRITPPDGTKLPPMIPSN